MTSGGTVKRRKSCPRLTGFLVGTVIAGTAPAPQAAVSEPRISEKVEDALRPIPPSSVALAGEIGRRIDCTINHNIKALDLHKNFTRHFEEKKGPDVVGGFVGMGMLIDAVVRFAAYSKDPEMVAMKVSIVDTILAAQLENGYVGFYKPERRLWNRSPSAGDNWDIHELAFLIDGLVSDYHFFGNQRALDAAARTADFILDHWQDLPDYYDDKVDKHVLMTGIDWAMLKLYRATGADRFLGFSDSRKSLYDWDTPITIGRRPGVSGHMFAYFAMCVAQLDLYRLTGDVSLLRQTENAIDFFLNQDGLTITGSAGQREIWTDDQDGEAGLGETCATAYQVRVYDSLLRLTGEAGYGDLIERTLYNGLFGAQSPQGEKIRYYTPFEGERVYYSHQHMCCPGNFRRIIAEIPGLVCYRTASGGVAVNLLCASTTTLRLDNGIEVRLRQETDFPTTGRVTLTVSTDQASTFPIALRIPSWARDARLRVNDVPHPTDPVPGRFLTLEREWREGDKITLELPMPVRYIRGRKRNAGRVALMRGPVIYGLNLAANEEATDHGKRSFHDLRRILLDPATLTGPLPDASVRPGGTAVQIRAWREKYSGKADRQHEFTLTLTEFPDPDSQFIYFKVPDYEIQVDDELLGLARRLLTTTPFKEK